jgi:hypothetical protein
MEILEQKITIRNSCFLIGKAKDTFSPLKEAITNSLDAIAQKQKTEKTFLPSISVSIHFISSKDLYGNETRTLDFISVEDNGAGFTTENFSRFKALAENTRGFNNRGTGKIQIFWRFDKVSINSTFLETSKWYKLNAIWKITGEHEDKSEVTTTQVDTKTIVKMSEFSGDAKEQEFFIRYLDNIGELKKDVLKRFLLRLWLGNDSNTLNLTIKTYLDSIEQASFTFDKSNIPSPDKKEKVSINSEQAQIITDKEDKNKFYIEWIPVKPKNEIVIQRFKLPISDMDENVVCMCSKDIVVQPLMFSMIKRKDANFAGFRYLTSIRGGILDDPNNVSQAVDKFIFPSKKDVEADLKNGNNYLFNQDKKFVFWDEIKDKVGYGLTKLYSDIEGLKEERDQDILALAKQYGISHEDAEASNIAFNDTEEEATEKLFETQAKRFAKQSIEIRKTYNELKELETHTLDPTSKQYRTKFNELSTKLLEQIPQQNKNELARYIIRRDIVVELLKLTLNNDLTIQKEWVAKRAKGEKVRQDKEGIIHDLIFKRRMKRVPNDLWILNEEFIHFDGFSDIELEKLEINGEKILIDNIDIGKALKSVGISKDTYSEQRPDIFIFPEEGKCILVELKNPDVDLSQHTTQIARYARLIANYSRKPRHFTQFFGFLIGETLDIISLTSEWKKVPFGNYRIYPSLAITAIDETEAPIANLYQEIIPLSEIAKRAEIRNKSFADKLGITSDDIAKAKERDTKEAPNALQPNENQKKQSTNKV